jgi:hypothetical protein
MATGGNVLWGAQDEVDCTVTLRYSFVSNCRKCRKKTATDYNNVSSISRTNRDPTRIQPLLNEFEALEVE